ncbi:unnamed protein product [Prorocentrum cordatum]|uniref:RRM domain-containing protein n=1 Tax=Prorocentrum cordatum TaxID=2364126 RepID=A0ABN9T240_9DINO|nr:unnamed protein product [Polarella glacialis]
MVDAFHHGTPKGAAGATVAACMRTPSDWGTPQYAPSPWDRAGAAGRAGKPHPGGGSGEAAAVAGVGRHGPQQPTADGTMPWAYQHAFGDLDAALGAWNGWGHEPTGMPPALGASWPGTLGGLGTPMPPWAVAQAVAAQMDAPQQVPPPWQAQADSSAVLLRGLPPDATEQDVFVFFAMHNMADLIEEGQGKVRMLAKSGSKTSGEAVVWMQSYSHACVALMELNGQALKAKDSAGGARTIEDGGGPLCAALPAILATGAAPLATISWLDAV